MGLLDGKTAIITGSARGIGRATAELFAAEGAQVTINDIDGDIAEQASGEIKGETVAVSGDLTKPGACDDVVKKALPGEMYTVFMHYKRDEWERYCATVTDWDVTEYLDVLP